jgi:secreted effector protein SseD
MMSDYLSTIAEPVISTVPAAATEHGEGTAMQWDAGNTFDIVNSWLELAKLNMLARDVIQSYEQRRRFIEWGLEINALETKKKAIDDSFRASQISAIGGILSGVTSIAGAGFGGTGRCGLDVATGTQIGSAAGGIGSQFANGYAAGYTRQAEEERAIGELQDKGAQSYMKTLEESITQAREIMRRAMEVGQQYMVINGDLLKTLARL